MDKYKTINRNLVFFGFFFFLNLCAATVVMSENTGDKNVRGRPPVRAGVTPADTHASPLVVSLY